MIWFVVAAALLLTSATVAGIAFWDSIRGVVAGWLRGRGLSNSALMDAWISLDCIASMVRLRVGVSTRSRTRETVSETMLPPESIDDPEVRQELLRRRTANRNVMHLMQGT